MSMVIFIGSIILLLVELNRQHILLKELNNKILEQKSELIKINNICENLSLSIINNNNYNFDETYINTSIILILLDFILIIIIILLTFMNNNNLIIIIIILLIIVLIIIALILLNLYLNNNNIKKSFLELYNKKNEINNKITEIDNIYQSLLINFIDNNNDINHINNNIDEYLAHSKYILSNIKNKKKFINIELKNNLILNKNKELINNMKIRLRNFNEVIPEIVKYELDEVNKDLDEYKKNLQIKINELNQLLEINSIIIDINS